MRLISVCRSISLLWLCLPACLMSCATATLDGAGESLRGQTRWQMQDDASGKAFTITVSAPKEGKYLERLPVIYVLDGDYHFNTVVEAVQFHATTHPQAQLRDAIIVGIGYPNGTDIWSSRALDLTSAPTSVALPPGFGEDHDLRRFITQTLRPKMNDNFPVDETREALFGHSFGGLFTLNTLRETSDAFDIYIAASPSLWWADKHFVRTQAPALAAQLASGEKALLLMVGRLEQPEGPAEKPARPSPLPGFDDRAQVDDVKQLEAMIERTTGREVPVVIFAGETHTSVVPAAASRAVRFVLEPEKPFPDAQ